MIEDKSMHVRSKMIADISYAEINSPITSTDIKSPNLKTDEEKLIFTDFEQRQFYYIRVDGSTAGNTAPHVPTFRLTAFSLFRQMKNFVLLQPHFAFK